MIIGCYSLDLYCDNHSRDKEIFNDAVGNKSVYHWKVWEYIAETGGRARQIARADGWKLNLQKGTAICPRCTK